MMSQSCVTIPSLLTNARGLDVTAITTDDQEIMAIQHKELPIYGLQYHPESIGSPDGLKMVENFVKIVAG